jgi:hypothetical protein
MATVSIRVLDYRRRAQRCRLLAENCPSPTERSTIVRTAETWEALASHCEQTMKIAQAMHSRQGTVL